MPDWENPGGRQWNKWLDMIREAREDKKIGSIQKLKEDLTSQFQNLRAENNRLYESSELI